MTVDRALIQPKKNPRIRANGSGVMTSNGANPCQFSKHTATA
jgi:hypothetical protein